MVRVIRMSIAKSGPLVRQGQMWPLRRFSSRISPKTSLTLLKSRTPPLANTPANRWPRGDFPGPRLCSKLKWRRQFIGEPGAHRHSR